MKELLRRRPALYSAAHRIHFVLSPARWWAMVLRRARYRDHQLKTSVIAGPGYLGYAGGIYNPGALPTPDGGALLLAKGQLCHWWDAVGTKADLYYRGDPVIFELDANLTTSSSRPVKRMLSFPEVDSVGYEDFRLFRTGGQTWVNHGAISLVRRHACAWTFREARQCLSRLDTSRAELTFLGHPTLDFPLGKVEKNWVYVEQDSQLYLFYSFAPYRVLRLVDRETLRFSTVVDLSTRVRLADAGGFGSMMSFSTNPVEYDGESLFLLVHQVKRKGVDRYYHHWGVLIDKASLRPRRMTREPLFVGMGARGRRPGIVYVSGVVAHGDGYAFFMGEGDAYVTRASISKKTLDGLWTDVSSDFSARAASRPGCEVAIEAR